MDTGGTEIDDVDECVGEDEDGWDACVGWVSDVCDVDD